MSFLSRHFNLLPSQLIPEHMTLKERLVARSGNICELCGAADKLNVYEVPPQTGGYDDNNILICDKCLAQIDKKEELDSKHWSVLNMGIRSAGHDVYG